ncbi:outer membrane beta-barrel protein [Portibacter lacus]|uniref:Outer membrane protein beta-barrel domain-containing protein n=1 Tax=Portibacter lacus TaxID=1099794 RepID=A0AA37SR02_9BACT|nr:hypothetical protein [Portibacter lacus]GLR18370.1 hypothetical protein GCM10007940_29860 [Portibacter lacus]
MDKKERKISEILKGQKFDLDKDALWSGMADTLPKQERKRRGFLWLLLLVIPLAYGGFYWTNLVADQHDNEDIFIAEKGLSDARIDRNTKGIETKVDQITEIYAQTIGEVENDKDLDYQEVTSYTSSSTQGRRNTELPTINQSVSEIENNINTSVSTEFQNINPASSSINQNENALIKTESDLSEWTTRNQLDFVTLEKIDINLSESLEDREPNLQLELDAHLTPTLCCVDQKWSVILLGGGLKSNSKVTGIEDRETGLYGIASSVKVNYHLEKRWTISGGLVYNQLNTRYIDQGEVREIGSQPGISQINIDALGVSKAVQGVVEEVSIWKRDINWHRTQHSFDFQVQLQKDFLLSSRWKVGVAGGIAYNLYTTTKGYGYDHESSGFYKFESDEEQNYKMNAGLKPVVGAELCYGLRNVELVLSANYKWNLSPINTQIENYQIKNSQTGIQLGTRYYLNGN